MGAKLSGGQRRAVEHRSGRLLITAGAGSGKTRTLAERFAAYVAHDVSRGAGERVDSVLTITYTTKAAAELAERVRGALRARGLEREARRIDGAWISTIHTLCSRILRREALAAGIDPAFTVANDVQGAELAASAFQSAAGAAIRDDDPDVVRLLEVYRYDDVRAATVSLVALLRSRGLLPADVSLESTTDVWTLRARGAAFLEEISAELALHAHASKVAEAHRAACEALRGRIEAIDDSLPEEDAAEHLWRALVDYGAADRTAKAIGETVERLRDTRADLIDASLAIVTRPLASGLRALAELYLASYEDAKKSRGIVDFDDMIALTARLFERRPDIAQVYRERFDAVMVDEFQDTDALQLALIETIGAPDLATVGDARQSIYSFRGADIEVYRNHRKHMHDEGATEVALDENYRSHADIIAFVNETFGSRMLFGSRDNELHSARPEPDPSRMPQDQPRVEIALVDTSDGAKRCDSVEEEAALVAERFAQLREHGFDPSEMAVLLRRYQEATPFADELEQRGLPATIVGGDRFFSLPVVAELRALCAVMANPLDDHALVQLLVSTMGGLTGTDLWRLVAEAHGRPRTEPLFERLRDAQRTIGGATGERAAHLAACIERGVQRSGGEGLSPALMTVVREIGYDVYLAERGAEGRLAWANTLKLIGKAAQFERSGGAGAAAFVAALDAERAAGSYESPASSVAEGGGSVTIMSVHAAKGLEFPVVAVPGLGQRVTRSARDFWRLSSKQDGSRLVVRLPSSWSPRSDERARSATKPSLFERVDREMAEAQSEEAKRLLYVACTRAEDVLVLVGSEKCDKLDDAARDTPLGWLVAAYAPALGDALSGEGESRVRLGEIDVRVEVRKGVGDRVAEGGECTDDFPQQGSLATSPPPLAASNSSVRNEPLGPVRPGRVSYSDLALYERCTLRYWAERVARMRKIELPGSRSATAFGSALHAVLQRAGDPSCEIPAEWIESVADAFGLPVDERERLAQTIARYRASDVARHVAAFPLVKAEYPFSIRVGGEGGPVLVGSIDLYARDGATACIVDYKSGRSGEHAELTERYRLQAQCYALAALYEGAGSVSVRFVRPEVAGPGGVLEEVEFEFERRECEAMEQEVLGIWTRMGAEPYAPLGASCDDACRGCSASGSVCTLTPRGRRHARKTTRGAG